MQVGPSLGGNVLGLGGLVVVVHCGAGVHAPAVLLTAVHIAFAPGVEPRVQAGVQVAPKALVGQADAPFR